MLENLYIKNFVLIDELNLDFQKGFSAFTGETGAGKSIFIDAISLLCAERASSSYVAKGKDKTIIEGTFDLSKNRQAINVLNEAGFDINPEIVTFTREIFSNGKSLARIDHRIVNLSLLKDCLKNEIDIHNQRENAYLLNTNSHIHLLDAYINKNDDLENLKVAFNKYDDLIKEKETLLTKTYNENDLEYFKYEIQEIDAANLKIGEDIELENKEKQYRLIKDSLDKLNNIYQLYDDSVSNAFYELNKCVQSLGNDENLSPIQEQVQSSYYSLSDAIDSLKSTYDMNDYSDDYINGMEERLFEIQKLKRKYGHSIEEILAKKEEFVQQVEAFSNREKYLNEIDKKINSAFEEYNQLANKISKNRKEYAKKLDKEIAIQLNDLKLPNAKFKTIIDKKNPSQLGNDKVEFYISMNKGEEFKPLSKTASGGELSRLMLGLKVIFTKLQEIELVIFDEIDTGVSGPVATSIGKKMKELSKDCQVFSVTHLAQVAAFSDQHYLVKKDTDLESTYSSVKKLNKQERINELALISSGEITSASLQASEELFNRSQS